MNNKNCPNCGKSNELNAEYCINCGNGFNSESTNNEENIFEENNIEKNTQIVEPEVVETIPEEPKKKKKGKGCLITIIILLIIAGLVVGGIFLYKKLNFFEDPFGDVEDILNGGETTETKSLYGQLEEDLINGKITKDQYIMQMAYSLYEPSMVSQEYKEIDNGFNDVNYLLTKANEMANELSDETVLYIFNKYTLQDVVWDVPEEETSSSDASASVYDYKVEKMSNPDGSSVNRLSKAVLSKNGNFIVYYTTDGMNATTDSYAKKVANYLEKSVKTYKKEYNLDFKYKPTYNFSNLYENMLSSKNRAMLLLTANKIDVKYLDTAMPVYLIKTLPGNPGFYCQDISMFEQFEIRAASAVTRVLSTEGEKFSYDVISATYTFPFMAIYSGSDYEMNSKKYVAGHELFHHYQHYICGNGEYGSCSSDLFTVETTADLAGYYALSPKKTVETLNDHNNWYTYRVEMSIDKIYANGIGLATTGYPAFLFSYNYANVVPNGKNILNQSLKEANTLQYLYNSAGKEKYAKVMTTLAEKNLTGDYNSKALVTMKDGKVYYPSRHLPMSMNILRREKIDYSAIHYYYFEPWYVKDTVDSKSIKFESSASSDELYLVFFVKEKNAYKKVYSQKLDKPFIINPKEFLNYEEIAFAIVNTSVSGQLNYTLNTGGDDEATVSLKSLGLKVPKKVKSGKKRDIGTALVCYKIDGEDQYTSVAQIKVLFDNSDEVNDLYVRATVKMNNYNPDDTAFKFAKKTASGLIFLLKSQYRRQLGSVNIQTKDAGDRYSITAHVKKDYYKAISNSFDTQATTKDEIMNTITSQGYTCQYE